MAESDRAVVAMRLAAELARARTEGEAAAASARAAGLLVAADLVQVWLLDRNRGYRFAGSWPTMDRRPDQPADDVARAVVFGSATTASAEPPYRSRLIVPLLAGLRPLGAVELAEQNRPAGPFSTRDVDGLRDLITATNEALGSVREASRKDQGYIEAINRLTHLFDLGRSIVAELEMDRLPKVVVERIISSFETEAAYMWLPDDEGENFKVAATSGPLGVNGEGWKLPLGQGVAGIAASTKEARLYDDPSEIPGIEDRPETRAGTEIQSVLVAPILSKDDDVLGVLETVSKTQIPEEADLGMLRETASTTALALDNANRLNAERRATDLSSLLKVAQELGAHLDAQKVAFTLVHKAASVVSYRRAAVGMQQGAGQKVVATSGETFVDETLPEIKLLASVMTWAAGLTDGIYVVQEEDGTIEVEREEIREKFRTYFTSTGNRSFLAVPLRDEEGTLGVFCMEGAEPHSFSSRELEAAGLLATQATVAIRNAMLYERIPMARVFRPLAERKERWARMPMSRMLTRLGVTALVAVILIAVPVPLRIGGHANVLPERRLPVTAEVEGRVAEVMVREGESVEAGQVIALLDDDELEAERKDAEARLLVALHEQNRYRADGQPAGAAVEQARLDGLRAELELWDSRLDKTRLRAPVSGIVATPRVEERLGTLVARGEVFCDVVNPYRQTVEVAIPEADSALIAPGMALRVKLFAHPTRSFRGTVERVGVTATLRDDVRVFIVRARLDAPDAALRSGMTGQVKINTGPASLGRVLFRRPGRWLWGVFWGWLP